MFISCVFPHEPILHALFYILCYIYTATSIIRSLSHMHKPFLGFSALCLAHTPTTWVFSPEISSLRPFLPANHTLRTSSLVFSNSLPRPTPTTWVFSPEISSLRPFRQQTILSGHHVWVFPTLFPAPRPPRGFSPREASRYAHFVSID